MSADLGNWNVQAQWNELDCLMVNAVDAIASLYQWLLVLSLWITNVLTWKDQINSIKSFIQ